MTDKKKELMKEMLSKRNVRKLSRGEDALFRHIYNERLPIYLDEVEELSKSFNQRKESTYKLKDMLGNTVENLQLYGGDRHVIIFGPHKSGKTSILNNLVEQIRLLDYKNFVFLADRDKSKETEIGIDLNNLLISCYHKSIQHKLTHKDFVDKTVFIDNVTDFHKNCFDNDFSTRYIITINDINTLRSVVNCMVRYCVSPQPEIYHLATE